MPQSAPQWYYSVGGQQSGPVSSTELKQLADARQITAEDLVWKDGMAEWVPASRVKGLIPPPQSSGPPPAPPETSQPGIGDAAKSLLRAVAGAATQAGERLTQAAERKSAESIATSAGGDRESGADSPPPKFSWRRKVTAVTALAVGGSLLFSCILCGVLGVLLDVSTSTSDVLKVDGSTPSREEISGHVERFGAKPEFSSWDGSFEEVKVYLSHVLNDPDSVEYDFWSKVVMTENGWDIRTRYRAKNTFGSLVLKDQIFTVINGAVVAVRDR